VKSFDDVDLASHLLQMIPRNRQGHYELSGVTVPESVHKLLEVLELIEKAILTDNTHEGHKNTVKPSNTSKKKIVSFNERIPKKHLMNVKHCVLCKKHGDTQTTHNTPECHKYEKNSTPKKGFIGRSVHGSSCWSQTYHHEGSAYVQLSTNWRNWRSLIRSLGTLIRSTNTITRVIAMTQTLPQESGMVVLGNML
jgi:hypothetical protein